MKGDKGFVKLILVIIIALVVLGFLGYDVRDIFNAPIVHDNLLWAWNLLVTAWTWAWEHLNERK